MTKEYLEYQIKGLIKLLNSLQSEYPKEIHDILKWESVLKGHLHRGRDKEKLEDRMFPNSPYAKRSVGDYYKHAIDCAKRFIEALEKKDVALCRKEEV